MIKLLVFYLVFAPFIHAVIPVDCGFFSWFEADPEDELFFVYVEMYGSVCGERDTRYITDALFGLCLLLAHILTPSRAKTRKTKTPKPVPAEDTYLIIKVKRRRQHLSRIAKAVQSLIPALHYVKWAGKSKYDVPNMSPPLYPRDRYLRMCLVKHPRLRPKVEEVERLFKRVNPTLELRLKRLVGFDSPELPLDEEKIIAIFDQIYDELQPCKDPRFREELKSSLTDLYDYSHLDVSLTSAAGYPYPPGVKRGHVFGDASETAATIITSDVARDAYFKDHVWYTTGRAAMLGAEAEDKARLVQYAGYALTLGLQKYSQPYCHFLQSKNPSWCSVGFSWFSRGAEKLATRFGIKRGKLDSTTHSLYSSDISGWDASVQRVFLVGCKHFHMRCCSEMMADGGYSNPDYLTFLSMAFDEFIDSKLLFPGRNIFTVPHGMKSGWALTAHDNTLIHEVILRYTGLKQSFLDYTLYGDDNFGVIDDAVPDELIISAYASVGMKVKVIHRSKESTGVDFLSKVITWSDVYQCHVNTRPESDTLSRLLKPEMFTAEERCYDPAKPAAEMLVGHIFDNFFQEELVDDLYEVLDDLVKNNHIGDLDLERIHRFYKWRAGGIPDNFRMEIPSIPTRPFIESLYGVTRHLKCKSDRFPQIGPDYTVREKNMPMWDNGCVYSDGISKWKGAFVTSHDNWAIRRRLVPWDLSAFGNAGYKALEAFYNFGGDAKTILDLGGHPGASIRAFQSVCNSIHAVSLVPHGERPFSSLNDMRGVTTEIEDIACADFGSYDLVYSDVFVPQMSRDTVMDAWWWYKPIIHRIMRNNNKLIFKFAYANSELIDEFYDLYRAFGGFHIYKPSYSYPWNSEYYVMLWREPRPFHERRCVFSDVIRGFFNTLGRRMVPWSTRRYEACRQFLHTRELPDQNGPPIPLPTFKSLRPVF